MEATMRIQDVVEHLIKTSSKVDTALGRVSKAVFYFKGLKNWKSILSVFQQIQIQHHRCVLEVGCVFPA